MVTPFFPPHPPHRVLLHFYSQVFGKFARGGQYYYPPHTPVCIYVCQGLLSADIPIKFSPNMTASALRLKETLILNCQISVT